MDPLIVIIVVLFVLWATGLGYGLTAGGALHVLLILAVILLIVRLLQGRRIL